MRLDNDLKHFIKANMLAKNFKLKDNKLLEEFVDHLAELASSSEKRNELNLKALAEDCHCDDLEELKEHLQKPGTLVDGEIVCVELNKEKAKHCYELYFPSVEVFASLSIKEHTYFIDCDAKLSGWKGKFLFDTVENFPIKLTDKQYELLLELQRS